MLKKKKQFILGLIAVMFIFIAGCPSEETATINITVDGTGKTMEFHGWWARTDDSQIVTFSASGGSYLSDFPSVWVEFPKQEVGSWSENDPNNPNVELQYWNEVGDLYRSGHRRGGACNITITGLDPLTGTFGGTLNADAGPAISISGDFNVAKSEFQGVK